MPGFDGGSIIAYLKLDRSAFQRGLKEAQAEADKGIDVTVKPEWDEKAAAVVDADEAKLAEGRSVTYKPEMDQAAAAAVELEEKALGGTIEVSVKPQIDSTGGAGRGLLGALLGQGLSKSEASSALSNLGFTKSEIGSLMQGVASSLTQAIAKEASSGGTERTSLAAEIVRSVLPTSEEMKSALASGVYGMLGDGSGKTNWVLGAFDTIIARDLGGGQAQLGSGLSGGIGSTSWHVNGSNLPVSIIDTIARDAEGKILGDLTAAGGAGGAGHGGGMGNLLSGLLGSLGGAAGGGKSFLSGLLAMGNSLSAAQAALLVGSVLSVGAVGGLGGAAAGALGGTAVAGVGTGIWGLLASGSVKDLMTAYQAQQQLKSGQITQQQYQQAISGLDPAAVKAVQGGFGANFAALNTSLVHPLQNMIVGQITGLISAAVTQAPALGSFATGAVQGMGGFLSSLTSGLKSPGFGNFLKEMKPTEVKTMQQFGAVIVNIGHAIGNLLLNARPLISLVGPGFVSLSKDFDKFTKSAKVGPGFLNSIVQLGLDFTSAFGAIETVIKKVARGAAPLSLLVFSQLPVVTTFISNLVKAIPDNLATPIIGIAAAIALFGKFGKGTVVGLALYALAEVFSALKINMTPKIAGAVLLLATAMGVLWKGGLLKTIGTTLAAMATDFLGLAEGTTVAEGILAMGAAFAAELAPILAVGAGLAAIIKYHNTIAGWASAVAKKINPGGLNASAPGSGIPSWLSGSWLGGIIPHAMGGSVTPGQTYLVGEQGPELFQSSTAGTIVPNHALGGSQQIIFQIDARGHQSPQAVASAVRAGISASLPSLQAALARGAA